jgi:hypothetical protein
VRHKPPGTSIAAHRQRRAPERGHGAFRMCFSAEASFAASAVLAPAGAYCATAAYHKDRRLLPLALVPLAFAAQQCAEGLVWQGLHSQEPELVLRASLVFLFFAIPFWPFWIPFCLAIGKPSSPLRFLLVGLILLSAVWIWFSYPLFGEPDRWLKTQIVKHSIQYSFEDMPTYRMASPIVWRLLYLAEIGVPLLAVSWNRRTAIQLIGGLAVGVASLIAYLVFWYAFTSVWCFSAAWVSLGLCVFFCRLPRDAAAARISALSHCQREAPCVP